MLAAENIACSYTRRRIRVWDHLLGEIPRIVLWLQLYYAESPHCKIWGQILVPKGLLWQFLGQSPIPDRGSVYMNEPLQGRFL